MKPPRKLYVIEGSAVSRDAWRAFETVDDARFNGDGVKIHVFTLDPKPAKKRRRRR